MKLPPLVAAALGCAVLAACAADAVPGPAPTPMTTEDPALAAVVAAARADAATRTGWPAAQFRLIAAERVTWSDGSLGCPQPGLLYTQALVPGFRVRLQGPAGEMDYHAGTRGAVSLCPPGRATPPVPGASRI